jgi:hypothetical protein
MLLAMLMAALCVSGGACLTYLFDDDADFVFRVSAGACVGLAALGLLGLLIGIVVGMNGLTLVLATAVAASPVALLVSAQRRRTVRSDLSELLERLPLKGWYPGALRATIPLIAYAAILIVLVLVFRRAMFYKAGELYTGVLNNWGDLPFHLTAITRFAHGGNLPPEDPTFAGVRFTYPFISDLVAGMFQRAGASLQGAILLENLILAFALVGILAEFAFQITKDRAAALLSTLLVLLNGGLGFVMLLGDVQQTEAGLFGVIMHLAHDYTVIGETTWRWGNSVTSLLVTQRAMLMGLPLTLVVLTELWKIFRGRSLEPNERSLPRSRKSGRRRKAASTDKNARVADPAYGKAMEFLATAQTEARVAGRADAPVQPNVPGELNCPSCGAPLRYTGGNAPAIVCASCDSSVVPPKAWKPAQANTQITEKKRHIRQYTRMIVVGLIAGLLPLVHVHSFIVAMTVAGCLFLTMIGRDLFSQSNRHTQSQDAALCSSFLIFFRLSLPWVAFFAATLLLGLPQVWWLYTSAPTHFSGFFAVQLGWDRGEQNALLFWLKNTGAFMPLLILAFVWRDRNGNRLISKQLALYYVPFVLCFIVPNVLRMAPWIWDNIKILFYWYVASCSLVALVLMRIWRGRRAAKICAIVLIVSMTLAGSLDIFRVASGWSEFQELNKDEVAIANLIERTTPPDALILHAAVHDNPVVLTGRRSLMGYPGHVWTHGVDVGNREEEIKEIYAGNPVAGALIDHYHINYAVVGPEERSIMPVNDDFFKKFREVGGAGEVHLYKLR